MKISRNAIVSLIATATLIVGAITPASADTTPVNNQETSACSQQLENGKIEDTTSSPEKSNLLRSVKKGIDEGTVSINGNKDLLNLEKTKIKTVENEQGKKIDFVVIPYSNDGGYNYLSNVTLGYETTNPESPVTQSETLFSKSDNNKFKTQVYQNGNLVKDELTDLEYVDGETLQNTQNVPAADPDTPELQGWNAKKTCIASVLGVNATVAGLVATTCVGACTAEPVGFTICAACIGGIAVVGGADITAIPACMKL
ncbi:hypothetical protein [uncultured Corynebacterium sp.]|uniref:hypothetical protein n=1 Tax=uncultured Corynebacterium sp. TaxID=159447 RepID=UPI0025F70AAE|nr:hypothetical protein [uncultured Corynebacterium sp.]